MTSTALVIVATELGVGVMAMVFFTRLIVCTDWRVLALLLGLRSAGALWLWRRGLAPVRAWRASPAFDAERTRAADRAFASLYRSFGVPYAMSWLGAALVAIGLGALGVPAAVPAGGPEQVAGVLGALGMGLGVTSVMRPFCDAYAAPDRLALGLEFTEHELGDREREAIGQRFALFTVTLIAAVFLAVFSLYVLERAEGERGRVAAEQRGRVAELAARLAGGELDEAGLDGDVVVVAGADLPDELAAAGEPGRPRVVIDARAGLVWAAAPLADGRWLMSAVELVFEQREVVIETAVFLALMAVFVGLASSLLNRAVVEPIMELDGAVRRLAEEGDIRALARVVPQRGDEIGALAVSFNELIDTFDALAAAASAVAEGELDAELEGRGDLQDAFRGMLARLHEMVLEVRTASLEVAQGAAEIRATARTQEEAVDHYSQRVKLFGEAVASLVRSAEEIRGTADEVRGNAEQSLDTTTTVAAEIAALDQQTEVVGRLLELLLEIADRSDLLALNGALEATRVGEAGRGFALVAAEMRRLAERVTGTVGSVREQVTSIRDAGVTTVEATTRSRQLADDTAAAARHISSILREQGQETEQLATEVHEVAEIVGATVSATRQTQEAAAGLQRQAEELERLTGRFKLRRHS